MRNFVSGELELVGSVIRRCIDATENGKYYRPPRRVKPGAGRRKEKKLQGEQLELFGPDPARIVQNVQNDPDRPLADLIPEAYQ